MKLTYKLTVIPIVLAIAIFSVIILLSAVSYRNSALDTLEDNQDLLVTNLAQSVDDYIIKYRDTVKHLETMDLVKDVSNHDDIKLETRGLSDKESVALRELFKTTIDIYPQFAYLETFTKDQAINVVLEPYSAQLNISEEDYLRGFSYRDWYKGAMSNNGIYVSEAYVSASTFDPVVAISTPIFQEAEPVAIMIGTLRLKELSDRVTLYNYGRTGITYIVDKNSHIVAHPSPTFFNLDELYSLQDSEIISHISSSGGDNQGLIRVFDNMTNEEVYVSYKKAKATDWYVVTQIAVDELEGPVWRIVLWVSIMSLMLMTAYIIFLYFNTTSIVKSLSFLNLISVHVSDNDLLLSDDEKHTFESYRDKDDEIGILMTSYKAMVERLRSSFTMLEKRNKEIDFLANHDPLTQIANRRQFRQILDKSLASGKSGAVILMDIDNFKLINDTLGHMIGDEVLMTIAGYLKPMNDDHFFVARFGGDEFIICLSDMHSDEAIEAYAKAIQDIFKNKLLIQEFNLDVRFSMGISKYPQDSDDKNQLIRFADLALYEAKKSGKNHYEFFKQDLEEVVLMKTDIEHELDHALNDDGFSLVYQPQVALPNGEIKGYEALIRLKSNLYNPGQFIGVAEETGQIIAIGRWVLKEAIRQQRQWLDQGFDIKTVAVNFSAAQLQDKGFVDFLAENLVSYDLSAKYIELEITENVFVNELSMTAEFLDKISSMGIKISIDDFGTGYSSLNYLISLPVSKIKMDRTLSEKYLAPDSMDTIKSIISLSHSLDLIVVAEGIENFDDVVRLIESGCDTVQGYYFSKPLTEEQTRETFGMDYQDKLWL